MELFASMFLIKSLSTDHVLVHITKVSTVKTTYYNMEFALKFS